MHHLYLTIVLPGGCNLKCPFCAISQRGESGEDQLDNLPRFEEFVSQILKTKQVSRIAIQG